MTEELSFEAAYERLEKILDRMNEGSISLEESLKLFEEADSLVQKCDSFLNAAEQKIETLIKNKENLVIDGDKPATLPLSFDKDSPY